MRQELPQFVWFEETRITKWSILIKGINIRDDIISGKFTRGLIGEEMGCEIDLENSGEKYTGEFSAGNIIQFKMDFSDGSTVQWEGKLESLKNQFSGIGIILKIKGSHYTSALLDKTVIKEYTNSIISDILKNLIDTFLTGFTYNNVQTINIVVDKIKWNNKPFLDCVIDLMKLGNADCFVDNSKDFNFFTKNSITNENEAVVRDQTLIDLNDFGTDSVDVRNKIRVHGEAGGLPVLHTSSDTSSQTVYDTKEKIITDTSLTDETQAEELSNAERDVLKEPPTRGNPTTFFMRQLVPGHLTYVVFPPLDITAPYRLAKYTFFVPNETMELSFNEEIGIPQLFKERIKKDIGQETITNPFNMDYSYNFTFDDLSKVDETESINITVSNGKLKVKSGSSGTMISLTKTTPVTVTSVHLLVVGEVLGNTKFYISADNGVNYQEVTVNTLTNLTNTGNQLKLKIELNSSTTEIDSAAILYTGS